MHPIDVIEINDYLTCFHWGRHADHALLDMRLGGGVYAIHKHGTAVVLDSMVLPGQGQWVKDYLTQTHGVTQFTLVSSHWHIDHIVGNAAFADGPIIGHPYTRDMMLKHQAALENGSYGRYPPFSVAPPNTTFEGRMDLWVADINVVLEVFRIHEKGQLSVYLPEQKTLLASDLLEDPLWFFDFSFASAREQLSELQRLNAMDIERIFPCHGSVDTIRQGGYSKNLITANRRYLEAMLATANAPGLDAPATDVIQDALEAGWITWWPPYDEVHAMNCAEIRRAGDGRGDSAD